MSSKQTPGDSAARKTAAPLFGKQSSKDILDDASGSSAKSPYAAARPQPSAARAGIQTKSPAAAPPPSKSISSPPSPSPSKAAPAKPSPSNASKAPPPKAAARAESAVASTPAPVDPGPAAGAAVEDFGSGNDVNLKNIEFHIQRAIALGKWPLILDSNPSSPFVTFMQYQSEVILVDLKKGLIESQVAKSKTVEEVREEWRAEVERSLKKVNQLGSANGSTLWMHFANSACALQHTYCTGDAAPLPSVIFDCKRMQEERNKKLFLRRGDLMSDEVWGDEFRILFTSTFPKEDYADFLADALPLHLLHVINVKVDSYWACGFVVIQKTTPA